MVLEHNNENRVCNILKTIFLAFRAVLISRIWIFNENLAINFAIRDLFKALEQNAMTKFKKKQKYLAESTELFWTGCFDDWYLSHKLNYQ